MCARLIFLQPLGLSQFLNHNYLVLVDAFGHGPSGHNIVHYPFRKRLWHLMQFHKLSNTVENVVIFGRCGGHLLDDSRHMSKNSGIEQR